jgi:hypothetical protein
MERGGEGGGQRREEGRGERRKEGGGRRGVCGRLCRRCGARGRREEGGGRQRITVTVQASFSSNSCCPSQIYLASTSLRSLTLKLRASAASKLELPPESKLGNLVILRTLNYLVLQQLPSTLESLRMSFKGALGKFLEFFEDFLIVLSITLPTFFLKNWFSGISEV